MQGKQNFNPYQQNGGDDWNRDDAWQEGYESGMRVRGEPEGLRAALYGEVDAALRYGTDDPAAVGNYLAGAIERVVRAALTPPRPAEGSGS